MWNFFYQSYLLGNSRNSVVLEFVGDYGPSVLKVVRGENAQQGTDALAALRGYGRHIGFDCSLHFVRLVATGRGECELDQFPGVGGLVDLDIVERLVGSGESPVAHQPFGIGKGRQRHIGEQQQNNENQIAHHG